METGDVLRAIFIITMTGSVYYRILSDASSRNASCALFRDDHAPDDVPSIAVI